MAIRHALTLDDEQLDTALNRLVRTAPRPLVEKTAFLLSFKAGLRVQEIAGLRWRENVLDAEGNIRHETYIVKDDKGKPQKRRLPVLFVGSDIGKYGSERTLRMHDMVYDALLALRKMDYPGPYVIPSGRKGASQALRSRAYALRVRINRYYKLIGFDGCTSHSGRRTFITKGARLANYAHCSLADIQQMAGHRQLTTTEQYIDTTPAQADLVGMM